MNHDVKIRPEYFNAWMAGKKRAEFRNMDRGYQVGDTVTMWEWYKEKYTGRCIRAEILWIDLVGDVDPKAFASDAPEYGVLSMSTREVVKNATPPKS